MHSLVLGSKKGYEIDKIQAEIESLEELVCPDGASDNLKQAVEMWNAEHYYIAYDNLVIEKDSLVKKLEEITNGD